MTASWHVVAKLLTVSRMSIVDFQNKVLPHFLMLVAQKSCTTPLRLGLWETVIAIQLEDPESLQSDSKTTAFLSVLSNFPTFSTT